VAAISGRWRLASRVPPCGPTSAASSASTSAIGAGRRIVALRDSCPPRVGRCSDGARCVEYWPSRLISSQAFLARAHSPLADRHGRASTGRRRGSSRRVARLDVGLAGARARPQSQAPDCLFRDQVGVSPKAAVAPGALRAGHPARAREQVDVVGRSWRSCTATSTRPSRARRERFTGLTPTEARRSSSALGPR